MVSKHKIEFIKKPLKQALSEYREKAPWKMEEEVEIYHPSSDVGIHLRDDNTLEIFAGEASIILDGQTASVIISCNEFISATNKHTEYLSKDSGLSINNCNLDSFWYQEDSAFAVLPKAKDSLDVPYLIAGIPAQGQKNVPLSDLLIAKRIFKMQSLLKDIEDILL